MFRPPALGRLRFAHLDDTPAILELVSESMSKNFRVENTADIVYLLQNCVISICQLDVNDTIVGFLAAKDYPPIPSVHPRAWEEYIWTKYKAIELTARNTLFIHLLCWNPVYARVLVDSMLKSLFMHDPYLQHIAMVKTLVHYPLLVPGQSRSEGSFRRVMVSERGVPGDLLPVLCVADRSEVSPRLRIRRAVEEDNDDIVPIIERHSTRLREIYGDFYVSELISRHPESERVLLVCEHNELAVGVMCLNTQINYEALEESYELSPFGGLRHLVHKLEPSCSSDLETNYSTCALGPGDNNLKQVSSNVLDLQTRPKDPFKSRVTWLFNEDVFKEFRKDSFDVSTTARVMPPQLDVLSLLESEDDEELEFDIVNIDTDLLRVPKMLTYDTIERGKTIQARTKWSRTKLFVNKLPTKRLAESIMKVLDDTSKSKETSEEKNTKKDKIKMNAPLLTDKQHEPTHYSGPPNAFLMELFAIHPDYDERYGFDILEVAYEVFPDRDYCIMCLPSNHPSFPLLEHFTLVSPFGTRKRFVNETLYVAHVNSVRGTVQVRPGEASDIPSVNDILEHTPRAQSLMGLFESTLNSCTLCSFVLLSQKQPIGMVILGPLEDGTAIRTQYALEPEPRRPCTDGTVLAGVMSPALEPHGRWFMRDILRQSHYTTLFWICRLFAKGDVSAIRNLMSLTSHMMPVLPRRTVPNISGNKGLDKIFQDVAMPFALWVLERPLTSLPKVFVNNSIVVVGASRTGLAFLETLLMGPTSQYLTFSNVTLVSEHGLPTVVECLKAADTCVPRVGRYTDRYLKSVPFYFYVDVMSTAMVNIDRELKCIHLKGGGVKYYDELVLTCGHQFQHPDYLHESLELVKEVEKGKPCDRTLMDNPAYKPDRVPASPDMPDNLMLINSLFDANSCMRKLMHMISDAKDTAFSVSEDNPVVVYGECIEAYNCLAALLELGLAPKMLAFVEPFPPEDSTALRVNCFNNEMVDERIQTNLELLGIRVLRRCTLAGWRQVDTKIEALQLMSRLHAVLLPCFALFYYGLKAIDINAFRAINESGLVYDGGLIVGPGFETNDPHIYGAGPCTRYSRRLYANNHPHHHYCSEDVGEALAKIFLHNLDPFVMADPGIPHPTSVPSYSSSLLAFKESKGSHRDDGSTASTKNKRGKMSRNWEPVVKFESPIVQFSTLPGPLYYMTVRKPGPLLPMEVHLYLPHQGHTLITDKNGNYFRLRLNVLHCVEHVTCLSRKHFSPELLGQLYGKHEAFFNKLLARYKMGEIDDLYEFFTQPWMAALYQETFRDLLRDINEQEVGSVYDLMQSCYAMGDSKKKDSKNQIQSTCVVEAYGGTCATESECEMGLKDVKNLGTFRSVIDKFVARSSSHIVKVDHPTDIPSECGQSEFFRSEATCFWNVVGGEQNVISHVTRYLSRHSVTNPHYARPRSE